MPKRHSKQSKVCGIFKISFPTNLIQVSNLFAHEMMNSKLGQSQKQGEVVGWIFEYFSAVRLLASWI